MKTKKFHQTVLATAVLSIAATLGAAGTALAAPTLQIVTAGGSAATTNKEETGDAGGTNYAAGFNTINGPGLPSAAGGWPVGPGFGPDQSLTAQPLGTTGFHAHYLSLTEAATVRFQYMGSGNATLAPPSKFGIDGYNGGIVNGLLEAAEVLFTAKTPTACSMQGGLVPQCQSTTAGMNDVSIGLNAGFVRFLYTDAANGGETLGYGSALGSPDTLTQNSTYFLGVDPYLATTTYQTSGSAVYAGLSDLPSTGDHDFQDLGVRISVVPEPGGLALVLAAFGGLALTRKRAQR